MRARISGAGTSRAGQRGSGVYYSILFSRQGERLTLAKVTFADASPHMLALVREADPKAYTVLLAGDESDDALLGRRYVLGISMGRIAFWEAPSFCVDSLYHPLRVCVCVPFCDDGRPWLFLYRVCMALCTRHPPLLTPSRFAPFGFLAHVSQYDTVLCSFVLHHIAAEKQEESLDRS